MCGHEEAFAISPHCLQAGVDARARFVAGAAVVVDFVELHQQVVSALSSEAVRCVAATL